MWVCGCVSFGICTQSDFICQFMDTGDIFPGTSVLLWIYFDFHAFSDLGEVEQMNNYI